LLRVVIRPRAAADLEEATDYYNRVASPAVAARFIDEFIIARDLIAERPDIGSRRLAHLLPGASLRFWSFDRFPFRIFYLVDGDTLQIVAVDHERRNVTKKSVR